MNLLDFHRLRNQEEHSWDREQLRQEAGQAFFEPMELLLPKYAHQWSRDQLIHFERTPWFEDCVHLCQRYCDATEVQRTWLRSRVDRSHAGKLGFFGLRAAVLAARERSTDLSRSSLVAFAIADLADNDIRDVLIGLSLLCHCGVLAGADMPALFREVAALAGPAINALYTDWADRYPNVQGIGSMGWKQVETEQGAGFRMA